jgi:hypothetical protein
MYSPLLHKSYAPHTHRKLSIGNGVRYHKSPVVKKDIKSLTFQDFQIPIALRSRLPKLHKRKQRFANNLRKNIILVKDLQITGKYACKHNILSPILKNNIGLDTKDFFNL